MILPKQFFGFVGNEKMILVNHGFSVQVLYVWFLWNCFGAVHAIVPNSILL